MTRKRPAGRGSFDPGPTAAAAAANGGAGAARTAAVNVPPPSPRQPASIADEENLTSASTALLSSTWSHPQAPSSSRRKWERHIAGGLCISRVSVGRDVGGGEGGTFEAGDEDAPAATSSSSGALPSSSGRRGPSSSSSSKPPLRTDSILAAALGAVGLRGSSSAAPSDDEGGGGEGGLRSPLLRAAGGSAAAASDAESGRATSRFAAAASTSSAAALPPPPAPPPPSVAYLPPTLVAKEGRRGVSVAAAGPVGAPPLPLPPPPAAAASSAAASAALADSAAAAEAASAAAARHEEEAEEAGAGAAAASAAVALSLACNVLLLAAKAAAYFWSGSEAVLASTVDSVIDLVSQAILAAAERASASRDARFPVGRARMSAVGVASAAGIMLGATLLVVQASASDLYFGLVEGQRPDLRLGPLLYSILGAAIAVKGALFAVCAAAAARAPPGRADTLLALKDDHLTDVLANSAALLAGLFAARAWWADPAAAILLSLYILAVWSRVFKGQVEKIVGKGADAETMSKLEAIAAAHDTERVFVDVIRAWHSGERIFTEVEIVMHPDTPLRVSHDAGLALQIKLERVPEVERCFVHVDYTRRAEPEHALDRALSGLPPIENESVGVVAAAAAAALDRALSGLPPIENESVGVVAAAAAAAAAAGGGGGGGGAGGAGVEEEEVE